MLLFFPNLPIRLDNVGISQWTSGPATKLMAWLFATLRNEVESGRVMLGVETHAMRRALEALIRMPVVYLPHPVPAKPGWEESRNDSCEKSSKCEDVLTTDTEELESGLHLAGQAGASEPGSLASKLAESPVSESLICSTDCPASFLPVTSYQQPDTSASPIVFGCYGAARWEKGSDIFLKAIRLVLQKAEKLKSLDPRPSALDSSLAATAAGRPLRFAIQWVEDFQDEKGNLVQLDPWLREHPQVEMIGRYFEGDEYQRRLAEMDLMVLPYRSPYRLRVSRVVIEAMLNGLPVIATKGTTLFEQAEEYGVVVGCEEGDAQSLAESILEVAERFESLRASAKEKVNAAAESFSVGFFRELLARNGHKLSTLNAGLSSIFSK